MRTLTTSISILALGVSLAFIAPGELPTAENNYSIWAEAEAANIRRSKLKQRNNGIRKVIMITEDEGDGESTASADIGITYMDELDNETTTSETLTQPVVEKVYFDWTPAPDFAGGTVYLGCLDCGDDGFVDVAIELGADDDWDGDNEDIEETTLTARAWRRGNGDYRFRLKGKPADVASYNFQGNGEVPLAGLTINGEPTDYQFTRETWRANLDIPADTELGVYKSDITIRDDQGVILDREVSTNVPEGETREGIVIDRIKFRQANDGNLRLKANVFTDDITDTPTLNAFVTDNETAANLISLEGAEPSSSLYGFSKTFDLVEPDNFSDRNYVATIELIDSNDQSIASYDMTVLAGEGAEVQTSVSVDNGWTYNIGLTYLENYEATGSDDGPQDVGAVVVALSGAEPSSLDRIVVRLVPDDGGSDLDEEGNDGDPETIEPTFVGALHVWNEKGASGIGGLNSGGNVSYELSVSGSGNFDEPLGKLDVNGGLTGTTGVQFDDDGEDEDELTEEEMEDLLNNSPLIGSNITWTSWVTI